MAPPSRPQGAARPLVRLGLATAVKAAAVSLIPNGLLWLVAPPGGATALWPLFLGVSGAFVGGAVVFNVCGELLKPMFVVEEADPAPTFGPEGVATQDEASRRIETLLMSYWEGE